MPHSMMSLMTDFIQELIRAANESDQLTHDEISRLFDRAIDTIRHMREQTGAVEACVAGIRSQGSRAQLPLSFDPHLNRTLV